MTVVVPCAGRALRLGRRSLPKCLAPVGGRATVLSIILRFWRRWSADFVLIAPPDRNGIDTEARRWVRRHRTLVQSSPDGIASALGLAERSTSEHFVFVLGDCLLKGRFESDAFPGRGIGVWRRRTPEAVRSNYGVRLGRVGVVHVAEKPSRADRYLCGMGVYFLDRSVFGVIKGLKRRRRRPLGITPVLQHLIREGYGLKPHFFEGEYLNLNTVKDLSAARRAGFA